MLDGQFPIQFPMVRYETVEVNYYRYRNTNDSST
jgi:hypothetical protein